jgi:hypothetical protein
MAEYRCIKRFIRETSGRRLIQPRRTTFGSVNGLTGGILSGEM